MQVVLVYNMNCITQCDTSPVRGRIIQARSHTLTLSQCFLPHKKRGTPIIL